MISKIGQFHIMITFTEKLYKKTRIRNHLTAGKKSENNGKQAIAVESVHWRKILKNLANSA